MLTIYQLGHIVLDFTEESWHGHEITGSSKVMELSRAGELLWSNDQYTPKPVTKKLSGKLFSRGANSKDRTFTQLLQQRGRMIDVFAFIPIEDCCGDIAGGCCGGIGTDSGEYLWLQTAGQITSIKVDLEQDGYYEISLNLTHNPIWQPINRFFWKYSSYPTNPFQTEFEDLPVPLEDAIIPYPRDIELMFDNCKQWVRRQFESDELLAYDPDLWAAVHTLHRHGYPSTGIGHGWTIAELDYSLFIEPSIWSAPPLTVYAFRNITPMSTITLTVTRQLDAWRTDPQQLVITYADITTAMGVYGGILPNDILVIGDVYIRPGIVIRNGIILGAFALPSTNNPGFYGQLLPGQNEISIVAPEAETAALHTYRRQ